MNTVTEVWFLLPPSRWWDYYALGGCLLHSFMEWNRGFHDLPKENLPSQFMLLGCSTVTISVYPSASANQTVAAQHQTWITPQTPPTVVKPRIKCHSWMLALLHLRQPHLLPPKTLTAQIPSNCSYIRHKYSSSISLQHPLEPIQSPWRQKQYVPLICQTLYHYNVQKPKKTTCI